MIEIFSQPTSHKTFGDSSSHRSCVGRGGRFCPPPLPVRVILDSSPGRGLMRLRIVPHKHCRGCRGFLPAPLLKNSFHIGPLIHVKSATFSRISCMYDGCCICKCLYVCLCVSRWSGLNGSGSGVHQTFHTAEISRSTKPAEYTPQRQALGVAAAVTDYSCPQW